MDTTETLRVLSTAYDEKELRQLLSKVMDVALSQQQHRLRRYDRELQEFEQRYVMDSAVFYEQFEAGQLGDEMDYFEWAGLYELRQALEQKIQQLERAR